MSARDDYPPFVGAHRHGETSRYEAMCDEIDRLRAMPRPYVRTSDEGTSYCSLGVA